MTAGCQGGAASPDDMETMQPASKKTKHEDEGRSSVQDVKQQRVRKPQSSTDHADKAEQTTDEHQQVAVGNG